MKLLTSFLTNSMALTVVATFIVLAIISGFALLMRKVRRKYKMGFWYYLILFIVFSVAFFLVDWLIDLHTFGYAVVGGLVSGVIFTVMWCFIDQGHEQIEAEAKKDEAERKRKGQQNNGRQQCGDQHLPL